MMMKLYYIVFIFIMMGISNACTTKKTTINFDDHFRIYEYGGGGYISVFDKKSQFTGIINFEGDWIIQPQTTTLTPYKKEGRFASYQFFPPYQTVIFNDSGKIISTLDNCYPALLVNFTYNDGAYCIFSLSNRKYGYVDTDGHWFIPAQYDNARLFSHGLAPVYSKEKKLWGYINKDNKLVIDYQYEEAFPFSINTTPAVAGVMIDSKIGFIDSSNNVYITPKYQSRKFFESQIFRFLNGYCIVQTSEDSLYRLIDISNKTILTFYSDDSYCTFLVQSKDTVLIQFSDNCKAGYLSIDGKIKIPNEYDYLSPVFDDHMLAVKNNASCIININNKIIRLSEKAIENLIKTREIKEEITYKELELIKEKASQQRRNEIRKRSEQASQQLKNELKRKKQKQHIKE